MNEVSIQSTAGLRKVATCVADDLSTRLKWAADEIDRLTAVIQGDSHKTFLIDSDSAQDYRVRNRVWGVLAWYVNHLHADLSDRDLALAAFHEYEKHWGRTLIDPNE